MTMKPGGGATLLATIGCLDCSELFLIFKFSSAWQLICFRCSNKYAIKTAHLLFAGCHSALQMWSATQPLLPCSLMLPQQTPAACPWHPHPGALLRPFWSHLPVHQIRLASATRHPPRCCLTCTHFQQPQQERQSAWRLLPRLLASLKPGTES